VARGMRPRVLLMLVTHGAAGLNLTEAQHVVLVEPLLDPAQELQATGRISRFGQTATTHVHR
jgi:E3 ubiquitin-protein ligase SHPRH